MTKPTTTSRTAALLQTVPMPGRIRALPRNKAGYPIPFFAADIDGVRDLRVGDTEAFAACLRDRKCWICGQKRTGNDTFVIGPMCVINRVTADPPAHLDCALYAVQVCPFLAIPAMVRRERGLPENVTNAGISIKRNPGVAVVYSTNAWVTFRPHTGGRSSVLFDLGRGTPAHLSWWSEGRPATRAEVEESINSGLPLLDRECDRDQRPDDSRQDLQRRYRQTMILLPKA